MISFNNKVIVIAAVVNSVHDLKCNSNVIVPLAVSVTCYPNDAIKVVLFNIIWLLESSYCPYHIIIIIEEVRYLRKLNVCIWLVTLNG